MSTVAVIIIVILFVVPLVVVGASFVWAAKRDGEEDRALQARVRGLGAQVVSTREWLRRLDATAAP